MILRILCLCLSCAIGYCEETCLANIRQVTFPTMGFEKAGESYFSPDGLSLIFQAVPKGQKGYQIYTIDLQSGHLLKVSPGEGTCSCGFYRPDGKKILFASSHEAPIIPAPTEEAPGYQAYHWDFTPYMNLYEANLDGSDLRRLTSGSAYHAECSYSADGEQIVYASNKMGHVNLYLCDPDGTGERPITEGQNCYCGGPFFSPQGDWIVFRADPTVKDHLQIYLIRPDGSELKQLTDDSHVNWAPFWHPNGQAIAYTTSRHGHPMYQIYLLDITTGKGHRITHSNVFEGLPSFSQDGKQITWTSKRGDGTCQVFIADFIYPPNF